MKVKGGGGAPASPAKKWTAKRIMKYLVSGAGIAVTGKYVHRLSKASSPVGQLTGDVGRLWYGDVGYKEKRNAAKKDAKKDAKFYNNARDLLCWDARDCKSARSHVTREISLHL